MTAVVRVDALAKVTLSLRVLGIRPDGYHDLEALTVSATDPHDSLALERRTAPGVELAVEGETGDVPPGRDNLAVRAAEALLAGAGVPAGVSLHLRKRIPAGGGLGGGSADAAAALVGVRALLGLDVEDDELARLGAGLGSDVPFCVRGGAAWMRDRGERLQPLALDEPLRLLVVVPPFRLATPAVYRAWDELGGPSSDRAVPAPRRWRPCSPSWATTSSPPPSGSSRAWWPTGRRSRRPWGRRCCSPAAARPTSPSSPRTGPGVRRTPGPSGSRAPGSTGRARPRRAWSPCLTGGRGPAARRRPIGEERGRGLVGPVSRSSSGAG
ncbi:MAG: hypothetical protein M5U14_17750 [Acidimicrobiia bacterium]|nr:hypothetical protein [Acidimicrobiia bacterium]